MRLNFKIKIGSNGLLNNISEPFGFDSVGYVVEQQKDYFGRSISFSGDEKDFEFNSNSHRKIFKQLISEYNNGLSAVIELYTYYDNELIYKGNISVTSVETDEYTYFKCKFINKDKLFILEKNKSIKVDINNIVDEKLLLNSVYLNQESKYVDTNQINEKYYGSFNFIKNIKKSEIKDTLTNSQVLFNDLSAFGKYKCIMIECKTNIKDIVVDINFGDLDVYYGRYGDGADFNCYLIWGDNVVGDNYNDWLNNANKDILFTERMNPETSLQLGRFSKVVSIESLSIGQGIWLAFGLTNGHIERRQISNASIAITAKTKSYDTITKGKKLNNVFKNVVKKVADINNVNFNNIDFFEENLFLNGNLIRAIENKKMNVSWDEIATILKEINLGYYYDEDTDTLHIDRYENFYLNERSVMFTNIANSNFKKNFDNDYAKNEFTYKFKSFQSQKENEVIGNAYSVHGEAQAYLNNKEVEGTFGIDLKHIRCSFMIEEQRRKGLIYEKETSTQEDSNIFLIHSRKENDYYLDDTFLLVSNLVEGSTTLANNGDFDFIKLGFRQTVNPQTIYINGYEYVLTNVTNTTITIFANPGTPNIPSNNKFITYRIRYKLDIEYVTVIDNGILNSKYSLRQNIENGYRNILGTYNYGNNESIRITEYKDNYDAIINNIKEDANIVVNNTILTPYIIECDIKARIYDYLKIKNNLNKYITILDHNKNELNLYIKKIEMTRIEECGRCILTIKGMLKND